MNVWLEVKIGYYEGDKPVNRKVYVYPKDVENFTPQDKEHIGNKVIKLVDDLIMEAGNE